MITRPIARADRTVTVIGLGTRGLSGALRGIEPEDVARVVPAAIEAGCTLVDVSPAWGESLKVTGEALRALRAQDRVCVACAVPAAESFGSVRRVQPVSYVQKTVEAALRAMKAEALPLAWLGGWRDAWLDDGDWPELVGTMMRLVREGKVLAWGVSAPDGAPGEALRAVAEPWIAAVSARCSLFDRAALDELVPAAAKAEVAVIAREPLARGALGGELAPTVRFPPEDERLGWSEARLASIVPDLARLARAVRHTPPAASSTEDGRALLDGMKRKDDVTCATVAELALRYLIDSPGITAAVVGARTIPHAFEALMAGDGSTVSVRIRDVLVHRQWGERWYDEAVARQR